MSLLSQSLKRFFRNLAAGSLGQIINLFSQIISVPLFLNSWSKPQYGEWLVLTSIPGLLWCFEGGLAGIAASRMTIAAARGDWHLATVLFQNVFVAQTLFCALVLCGTLVFVHLVDVSHLLHFSHIGSGQASTVLVLMICYMIIGFFINLLKAAYRASEIEARGIMAQNMWRSLDVIVTISVLAGHGSPVLMAMALTASATVCFFLIFQDVSRKCLQIQFGVREASWSQTKALAIDGAPMLAGMAANALSLQGYPLMVNRFLNPSSVVNLTVVRTVGRTLLQGIQLLTASSSPELSRTYGRKDVHGYLRLLKIVVAISALGGLLSCIAMPIIGPWVIRLWTGGKINMDSLTLFLFGVTIAMQGGWGICLTVLVASNMHHLFNYLNLALTVLALLVVPHFMLLYGFKAIPVVMICSDFSLLVAGVMLCHKKTKHVSLWELYRVFHPLFYLRKIAEFRRSGLGASK